MDTENDSIGSKIARFIVNRPIWQLSLSGIILGFAYGFMARVFNPSDDIIKILKLPGDIFLNSLKAVVLVFVIVIMLRIPLDLKEVGQATTYATLSIAYYLLTSFFAALLGLFFVYIIKPGTHKISCSTTTQVEDVKNLEKLSFLDSMINVLNLAVPQNVLRAITEDNLLGILVVFLTLGFMMTKYGDTKGGKQMKNILDLVYQTILDAVYLIITMTPIGVFSLIVGQVSRLKDYCIFARLGIYIAVFIGTNLFLDFVCFPLLYLVIVRKNPFKYIKHFISAILTALATASSAAALPLNLEGAYEAGCDKNIANFVLPLGSTLNMNGSAIYYPVTITFIGNLSKKPLPFGTQILLAIVTTLITVGGAPVPSGALVYLTLVASTISMDVPPEIRSLIWAIDPIMDRILTVTSLQFFIITFYLIRPQIFLAMLTVSVLSKVFSNVF